MTEAIQRINRGWDLNHQPKDFMIQPHQRMGNIRGMHTESQQNGMKKKRQFLVQCIRCGSSFWSYQSGHYQFCSECKVI